MLRYVESNEGDEAFKAWVLIDVGEETRESHKIFDINISSGAGLQEETVSESIVDFLADHSEINIVPPPKAKPVPWWKTILYVLLSLLISLGGLVLRYIFD